MSTLTTLPDVMYRRYIFYIVLNTVMALMTLLAIYADLLVIFKSRNIDLSEITPMSIEKQVYLISGAYILFMVYRIIYTTLRPMYSTPMHMYMVITSIAMIAIQAWIAYTMNVEVIEVYIMVRMVQLVIIAVSIYDLTFRKVHQLMVY